jgi:hypothetical protein
MFKRLICFVSIALLLGLAVGAHGTTYYVSPSGDDGAAGTSPSTAWATTDKVNSTTFSAGDSVLFEGGETFSGGLVFTSGGTPTSPIVVGSYGSGRTTINSDFEEKGFHAIDCAGLEVRDLIFVGSGNIGPAWDTLEFTGIKFTNTTGTTLEYLRVDNVDVSAYRSRGILLHGQVEGGGYRDIQITNCVVHDIGVEGINTIVPSWPVRGDTYENLYIGDCVVHNITGVAEQGGDGHNGSGIVLGGVNGGVIEFCDVYNTGRYCATGGGGPLGLWGWECVNIDFRFNESHHNRTSGGDGGGLDLDGGMSFCKMQYNYAHDNDGGNLIMQFKRSRYAGDHIYRYNIIANDGIASGGPMGLIQFYSDSSSSPDNVDVYGNTLYVGPDSRWGAIGIWTWHGSFGNINIRNNIIITEPGKPAVSSWSDDKGINFQGNVLS